MPGPKPDMKMVKKVMTYRKRKLSYRSIAKLLSTTEKRVDEKQVRRWVKVRTSYPHPTKIKTCK